jgi:predicted N-acetyltransferase YhbS
MNVQADYTFAHDRAITEDQFIDVLNRSTLGERRPVENRKCISAMLRHGNLLCTAWAGETLVGVARSVTDFEYCCYLSDLAVDQAHQNRGIGRRLIALTQSRLGPHAKIILIAAPKAVEYYPRLGFAAHPSAWTLPSTQS